MTVHDLSSRQLILTFTYANISNLFLNGNKLIVLEKGASTDVEILYLFDLRTKERRLIGSGDIKFLQKIELTTDKLCYLDDVGLHVLQF